MELEVEVELEAEVVDMAAEVELVVVLVAVVVVAVVVVPAPAPAPGPVPLPVPVPVPVPASPLFRDSDFWAVLRGKQISGKLQLAGSCVTTSCQRTACGKAVFCGKLLEIRSCCFALGQSIGINTPSHGFSDVIIVLDDTSLLVFSSSLTVCPG